MVKLFNNGWEFALKNLGEKPVENDYKPVDIPHDWLIYDTYNLYKDGDGYYRKSFNIEKPEGKIYTLRFEGVYMDSEIFLNGEKVFEWKYGYTTFDVPLKPRDGMNTVEVVVHHKSPNTRWYSGAGIFRNVWLRETGPNRIADDGTYVVSYIEGQIWQTEIDTEVNLAVPAELKHTLFDVEGNVVVTKKLSLPDGSQRVSMSFEMDSPELWSLDRPYLYSLLTEIYVGEERVDERYERIGYRYTRFDKNEGFFLNGKNIKINGACMHHDLGALGAAVNKTALKRQLLTLKDMGVNAIRTSHNPPSVEFMDLADELGILVDSEAFDMWESPKTEFDYARFFPEWHERDVASWIRRDRNHPSLIMWSIGNEIGDTNNPEGLRITKELKRCVRIHDYKNAHPITIGSNYMRWQGAQNCAEELDLVGYNYTESIYDEHHAAHPNWVIYGSETASTIQSRGVYHFPAEVFVTTHDDLQCSSIMNCATGWGAPTVEYNICEDRKRLFSLGQFIWTGWDYIGEPTPYRTKNSYFGHVDTAGFAKDSYYAYKAEWNKNAAPFVHLFPYWDFNEGQLVDIAAYSNCYKTEVFLNGVSLGTHIHDHSGGDRLTGRWKVKYHKGEIRAVGYDENGNAVCEDIRRSFTDPAKIVLTPDKTSMSANGEDMIFVTVSVVDADGNPVENARNRINVELSGAARLMGIDNGDSSDYEQYKGATKRLFSGKLLIMLGALDEKGDIILKVSSPDLPDAILNLKATAARVCEGVSFVERLENTLHKDGIPVRKIDLSISDQILTPDCPTTNISLKVFPENRTVSDGEILLKVVNDAGTVTNVASIEKNGLNAVLKALGDGSYRLRAYCKNGTLAEEVISEVEMENKGFGAASFNPYKFVPASLCNNHNDFNAAMEGGVITKSNSDVIFEHVDFGAIGSNEFSIGVYDYLNGPINVIITIDGEPITESFFAPNEWNTYKYNTYKLDRVYCGLHTVTFRFPKELRFRGFIFSSPRRIGSEILAVQNDGIYGDSFSVGETQISHIGNNVSLVFNSINLGDGADAVEINGHSYSQETNISLRFDNGEVRDILFKNIANCDTAVFDIAPISGTRNLSAVFMPGADFDLHSIRFLRKSK